MTCHSLDLKIFPLGHSLPHTVSAVLSGGLLTHGSRPGCFPQALINSLILSLFLAASPCWHQDGYEILLILSSLLHFSLRTCILLLKNLRPASSCSKTSTVQVLGLTSDSPHPSFLCGPLFSIRQFDSLTSKYGMIFIKNALINTLIILT